MKALDRRGRVTAVPFQKPGVPEAAGLSLEECEAAAWTIEPNGSRHRGAGAVNAALAWALGWPVLIQLYYLPIIRQIQDAIYEWVAANRGRLPGTTPYCQQYPEECGQS